MKRNNGMTATTDTRNIADEFRGMTDDIIRLELQKRRVPMINVAMNLTHDFNKGSVMRAHNAFAGEKFIFVNRDNNMFPGNSTGAKHWDKRGAVGVQNYESIEHVNFLYWKDLFNQLKSEGYYFYAVDNTVGYDPRPIYDTVMPVKSVFVYGEEQRGLSDEMIRECDEMIYIPQYGTVRSLNISQAAAVVMYEYSRQHRLPL